MEGVWTVVLAEGGVMHLILVMGLGIDRMVMVGLRRIHTRGAGLVGDIMGREGTVVVDL